LITSVVGHAMVIVGLGAVLGMERWMPLGVGAELETFTLLVIALVAATYFLFDDFVHRGLSAFAALSMIVTWALLRFGQSPGAAQLVLRACMVIEGVAVVATSLERWHPPLARPAWYALVLHLAGVVAILACLPFQTPEGNTELFAVWSLAAALGGLSIAMLVQNLPRQWPEPAAWCVLACLLLAVAGSPGLFGAAHTQVWFALSASSISGLLLAATLIVIGKARGDLLVRSLGVLALPPLVILYYYSLELSLLAKAGVLLATGLVPLALRSVTLARAKTWEIAQ
jgi:hypothetical protein